MSTIASLPKTSFCRWLNRLCTFSYKMCEHSIFSGKTTNLDLHIPTRCSCPWSRKISLSTVASRPSSDISTMSEKAVQQSCTRLWFRCNTEARKVQMFLGRNSGTVVAVPRISGQSFFENRMKQRIWVQVRVSQRDGCVSKRSKTCLARGSVMMIHWQSMGNTYEPYKFRNSEWPWIGVKCFTIFQCLSYWILKPLKL